MYLNCNGWTERCRIWTNKEEGIEAGRADEFIYNLISNPFTFELKGDVLKVDYLNEIYVFIRQRSKMDSNKLIGTWNLTAAPLMCRQEILNEASIRFKEGDQVSAFDTGNSTGSEYNVIVTASTESKLTGIIHTKCTGWTQRYRCWPTEEERDEAKVADEFMHALIRNPIQFELVNNTFKVNHLGSLYEFTREAH